MKFNVPTPGDYVYYRIAIDGAGGENFTHISEWQLWPDQLVQPVVDGLSKSFTSNKLCTAAPTFNLVYQFNTSARVNSYILANASGATRDPKTYEIQGSNDNLIWTTLTRVDNLFWKGRAYMYGGNIATPAYYKYYRFDMQANNGDAGYSEIGDLLLFGDVTDVSTEIAKTEMSISNVYGLTNHIVINGSNAVSFRIMDVTGKIIKQGRTTSSEVSVPMTKGLYLVKTESAIGKSSVTKVIVK